MPYNGQGVFTPKHNWVNEAAAQTPILPTNFDDQDSDMAAALSNAITRDGQGGPMTDIPWNNYSITGLRAPMLAGDAVNKGYVDTAAADRSMGGFHLTNLANPVNPQDAVTKAYVGATTTQLPDQSNQKSKFLRTDGAIGYWDFAGIGTVNALVTTSTTITGAFVYVPVQMATSGQSITLPAATGLQAGAHLYTIDNTKGGVAVTVRDSTGIMGAVVAPGGIAFVSLRDASTAAGVWTFLGNGIDPGAVTIDQTLSTTYGTTIFPAFVAMDTNTSVHFVALAAGGYAAFVVDNLGKVISTPVVVDTTSGQAPVIAYKIDATRLIVFTTTKAVVITLSGATAAYSLTVGVLSTLTVTNGEDGVGSPNIAQLTPTLYVTLSAGGALQSAALSVSGTTITNGALFNAAGSGSTGTVAIYPLTSTTALIIYSVGGQALVAAYVVSVSGTTITAGTIVTATANTPISSTCLLSATKALFFSTNGNLAGGALAITVSGTAVTIGSALTIGAAATNGGVAYTANSASRFNPRLLPLGPNSALLTFTDGTTSRALVLSESGGTLTPGSILSGTFLSGFVAAENTTDFIAITNSGSAGALRFSVTPHRVNGTNVTVGIGLQAPDVPPTTTAGATPAVRLPQGDYLITSANSQAIPVYRSSGDVAYKRGVIGIPNLAGPTAYPLMAVSPNRLVLMAASGTQIRILNIEVAA